MAMDQKAWEAMEKADLCRDGHELFRIAKQRTMEKTDVVGVSYLEDKSGAVKVSVAAWKKIRKENMEKIIKVKEEVWCVMNRMIIWKVSP